MEQALRPCPPARGDLLLPMEQRLSAAEPKAPQLLRLGTSFDPAALKVRRSKLQTPALLKVVKRAPEPALQVVWHPAARTHHGATHQQRTMDPTSLQGSAQRVAFTADFLRCSVTSGRYRNAQSRNVSWLREVLTGGLAWRRQSLELQTVFPAEGSRAAGGDALGRGALAEYKADAEDAWARRYDVDQLKVFKPYLEALVGFDLVVGFELPPSVKRHLHCHGRRYVSFHIHALRMLRDLCLGATTNDPAIAKLLTDAAVPEHEISRQVHRFRALCSFHRVPELMLPEGLPVLIGQTARDSILISAGRFVDWPDCEDELALALRDHDACIFLEHPGRQDSRSVCEYLRCRLGKAVIATSTNGYGALLSTARIPEVLTLSSSLGVEAQAFGLPTRFLLGDPRQRMRVDGVDLGVDRPLTHHVLGDDFWNAIWGDGPPSQVPNDGFYLGEHYLRDSLVSWSYQLLRDRLQGARSRRTWMPAAGMDSPRRTSLLTALRDGPDGMGAG